MGAWVTMQDVADLAGVRRQVVTAWRGRPSTARGYLPFPGSVGRLHDQEVFDRDEVVRWLEATGRGNNSQVADDALTLGVPANANLEDVVTLSCLRFLAGEDLTAHPGVELHRLADRVDPHDRLVAREIRRMRPSAALVSYVDALAANSYGPSDCLTRIERSALARRQGDRGWSPEFVGLLTAVLGAVREHVSAGNASGAALDIHTDGLSATDPLPRHLAAGFAGVRVDGDDELSRAHRRRATLGQIEFASDGVTVHLRLLVGMGLAATLEALDSFAVDLAAGEWGIAVGSATPLADRLTGQAHEDRSATLRKEHVPVVLRFPRGSRKAAHRESLAVWVVRKPVPPHPPADDDLVHVADLDGVPVQPEDLTSDVVAALLATNARAYRFLRALPLGPLVKSGPLVPRGGRATPFNVVPRQTHLDRVFAASLDTSSPLPGFDVEVADRPGAAGLRLPQRGLDRLRIDRHLRCLSGHRIDFAWTSDDGTVPLLTWVGPELGGIVEHSRRIDPVDLERLSPGTHRTEPGDVVIVDGRRPGAPAAIVDRVGGHLAVTPCRILRLRTGAPIGPETLAALVSAAPPGSEWTTWTVPELPPADATALDAVLLDLAAYRDGLTRRLAALSDLAHALVSGTSAGAISLPSYSQST